MNEQTNEQIGDFGQTAEDILACTVSDQALEAAGDRMASTSWGLSCRVGPGGNC
jgi:hypothetical protein